MKNVLDFVNATSNPIDPVLSCLYDEPSFNSRTAWFQWSPTISGFFDFSTPIGIADVTGQLIYSFVAILEGSTSNNLTEVACLFPVVRGFEVKTGKSYHIQVLENFNDVGSNLVLTIKPSVPALPNVDCPNALTIPPQPSFPYTIVTDLVTPTKTPDNPILSCRELVFES
jgi:hypothetical protein